MKHKIEWSGRSIEYTKDEIDTIVNVAKNADPLTQGEYLSRFEDCLKKTLSVDNVFGLTSAASALELAAVLSGIGDGDEVIIPSHTYCASAIPFGRTGASIVWADIDPKTFLISPQDIERKITKRTKMIVAVHLYGLSCDMQSITNICKENNILLVEDCAQAIGSKYQGKQVGSFGDYACFSFHAQKNITTLGEGGALVVKDYKKALLVPGLRHNGHASYGEREHYWKPAMGNVDMDINGVWPFNYSMTEVQAALGIKLLERLDDLNTKRRERALKFIEEMKDCPELIFQETEDIMQNSYHLLPARYESTHKNNDDLISLLSTKYGIKAIVQYYPLNRYPLFDKMGFGVSECPNANFFFDNMISFPFHHWMSEDDFTYMIESVKSAVISHRGN